MKRKPLSWYVFYVQFLSILMAARDCFFCVCVPVMIDAAVQYNHHHHDNTKISQLHSMKQQQPQRRSVPPSQYYSLIVRHQITTNWSISKKKHWEEKHKSPGRGSTINTIRKKIPMNYQNNHNKHYSQKPFLKVLCVLLSVTPESSCFVRKEVYVCSIWNCSWFFNILTFVE